MQQDNPCTLTVEAMRYNLDVVQSAWHSQCVACGRGNSNGLGLHFYVNEEGQVEANFPCRDCFEGYPQSLHGGFVAVLLDSAMTNCLFAHGLVGMTGELNIRFHHVVNIGKAAKVRAWLESSRHRLHVIRACLEQEGQVKATSSGRFLETLLDSQNNESAYG